MESEQNTKRSESNKRKTEHEEPISKKVKQKKNYIFSGDRHCENRQEIVKVLNKIKEKGIDSVRVIQGGCSGVDNIVKYVAEGIGFEVITVKANWKEYGKAAGPKRNEQMIKEYPPTRVYMFHDCIESSKGTKHMMQLCQRKSIPYELNKTKL